MLHPGSEQAEWIDLYVAGRLPAAEEAELEEHLLECADCREAVQAAEDLKRGLQGVVAEELARGVALQKLGWLARLATRVPRWGPSVGLGLVIAAVPAWWLWNERRQLEHELSQVRAALAVAARPDPAAAAQGARLATLERELADERRARQDLSRQLTQLREPPEIAAVFSLGFLRDGPGADQVVHLPRDPGLILLSIEPPAEGGRYDVTVLEADGRALRTVKGLAPSLYETLPVPLHSRTLSPGRYRLRVRPAGTAPGPAHETSFRVVR